MEMRFERLEKLDSKERSEGARQVPKRLHIVRI